MENSTDSNRGPPRRTNYQSRLYVAIQLSTKALVNKNFSQEIFVEKPKKEQTNGSGTWSYEDMVGGAGLL